MTERENQVPVIDRGIDAALETEQVFSNTTMPAHVNGIGRDTDRDGFDDALQLATNGGRLGIQTELVRAGAAGVIDLDSFRAAARERLAA